MLAREKVTALLDSAGIEIGGRRPWNMGIYVATIVLIFSLGTAHAQPPYAGTIFEFPNTITETIPSRYSELAYTGQGDRLMFDRRINAFATYFAYLFEVSYTDGLTIEFQVNPEFDTAAAAGDVVEFYATVIGRLPRALREHVQTSWIHMGDELFGGGNNNLLIHTGSIAQSYIQSEILEEVLAHEAVHTSLDAVHASAPGWIAAQQADPEFISLYARDFPDREDLAESFVPWLAVRCAAEGTDPDDILTIQETMPNRMAYLDAVGFDLQPLDCVEPVVFVDRFE